MGNVKLINRFLWTFNIFLGAAVMVFAFQYLLFPKDQNHLKDLPVDEGTFSTGPVRAQNTADDGFLKTLANPLEKPKMGGAAPLPTLFRATLKGTLPSEKDPKVGIAFIKSMGKNMELVAYMGEPIFYEGKLYEEFRGWTLTQVSRDRALFTSASGQKAELIVDQAVVQPPGAPGAPGSVPGKVPRIGQAYAGENYKSRILASSDGRQVWGLDQDEIDWAFQNVERIMDQDFRVAPYGGGGLRVESLQPGSIGATRGIVAGDVVREVNGQPLSNVADVRALMNNPAMRQQSGLRITIERAGKPVVIEYRPLPR